MFGEVAMYLSGVSSLFGNGVRNINTLQANTSQVANTENVPSYRTHIITHANQNTASQNNQVSFSSTPNLILTPPAAIDNKMEFPGINYDLLLEQESAGIAVELSGDTIGLESQESLLYGRQLMTEHGTNILIQDNGPGDAITRQFMTDENAGADPGLFTYVQTSANLDSQDSDMRDVKFNNDGTKVFMLGRGSDGVYEYSLSTAWDISTLTFVQELDIGSAVDANHGRETAANSIEFNINGSKLFVLGQSDDDVNEWALSTPFDLSTATFTDSYDISSQENKPYGLAFNNDGTKMYVCGWTGDDINEYTLTTGFDVSTATYSQRFSTEGTGRSNPNAVQFNADGTFMYVLQGDTNARIQEYKLATAFDISTAYHTNRVFDGHHQHENRARGFCFGDNYSKLFITGWRGDDINAYTVNYAQLGASFETEYESLLQEDDVSKFLFEDYYDTIIQEDGSEILLEDQDGSSDYLLFEPLEADAWILSEDDADSFHIVQEDNVPIFNILLEDASGSGKILYEATTPYLDPTQTANTFMLGVEPQVIDATNYLLLEAVPAIYDTKITVTDRDEERGFLIPKIEFPEEELGAVHIDMGFGSQLRLETDLFDTIQLEYSLQMDLLTEDGQPLVTESLDNKFIVSDLFHGSAGETGDILLEDGGLVLNETQSIDIETDGFDFDLLMLEDTNGMFPVYLAMEDTMTDEVISDHLITIVPGSREEHADEFQLLTEHSTGESSGGYTITHSELVTEGGDKLVGESAQDALGISAQTRMAGPKYASGKGEAVAGFVQKLEGTATFKSGDDYELLAEDGKRFITEDDLELDNLLSEAGDIFVDEADVNRKLSSERGDPADGESFVFLRASYDRKSEVIGTGTFFETDFNAPIVLEDRTGVIELEDSTSQEELIVLENSTDRIFEYILAEDGQAFDRIAHENYDVNETKRRLVHQEYLDIIIDESSIALEEDFKMQLEDYCSTPNMQTLVAENGDNLELEHLETTFFGDERLIAIENLANERELTISDFTPNLALETDLYVAPESIILESHTTWTDDAEFGLILNEDESLIAAERTDSDGAQGYILHEEHYAHEFNEGTVTVLNDYDPDGSHSANQSTIEIQLDGNTTFPHGVRSSNAKIVFHSIDDSADVVSVGSPLMGDESSVKEHIIQADFGSFLLEDGSGVLLDDADGDKVKRDLGFTTSQNYVLKYGIAERNESDVNFLKVEENTSVTSSDTPDYWQYTINGWKSTINADTTMTSAELKERVGNDIVMEDGERLLTEDGEVTQDNLTLLLEDDNYLNMEENDSLLLEEVDYYHPSKMLQYEEQLYRIDYIANNTFFKVSTGEELYPILDATIKTYTQEAVSS